jgi:enterochelin esterase-like enzyme
MKRIFLLAILAIWLFPLRSQSFQKFIEYLGSVPAEKKQAAADSFLKTVKNFPYIENDTLVHFIYNGDAQSVVLVGDPSGWNKGIAMLNLTGTKLWYLTQTYEPDARLDYKFLRDKNDWLNDPLNPHTCTGGYGPNSELRMPGYPSSPYILEDPSILHGSLVDTVIQSFIRKKSYQVTVYIPAPDAKRSSDYLFPVMLFHDGLDYVNFGSAKNTLDNLIAHGQIEPLIGVFVVPAAREEEYTGSKKDEYCEFIVKELMPYIEKKYSVSRDPAKRANIGVSAGGNIALHLGLNYPDLFGKLGTQSGVAEKPLLKKIASGKFKGLVFYVDIGKYDIPELISCTKELEAKLKSGGYYYQFREWHEGHSWGNWGPHLYLPLMHFFPKK